MKHHKINEKIDSKIEDLVANLRKNNMLSYNICDMQIENVVNKYKYVNDTFSKNAECKLKESLLDIVRYHYQAYDINYWNEFLDSWMPKLTHIAFVYTSYKQHPHSFKKHDYQICAVAMYIEKPLEKTVYIRLLASKLYCGGNLLKYIYNKYENSPIYKSITLNSEPDAVYFYFKHGFLFSKNGEIEVDYLGVRYPCMVRATCKKDRDTANKIASIYDQWYWPGIGYYLRTTYRTLSSFFA